MPDPPPSAVAQAPVMRARGVRLLEATAVGKRPRHNRAQRLRALSIDFGRTVDEPWTNAGWRVRAPIQAPPDGEIYVGV
jgi:hypothetical protein